MGASKGTWNPKVCEMINFWTVIEGFWGHYFTCFWGPGRRFSTSLEQLVGSGLAVVIRVVGHGVLRPHRASASNPTASKQCGQLLVVSKNQGPWSSIADPKQ